MLSQQQGCTSLAPRPVPWQQQSLRQLSSQKQQQQQQQREEADSKKQQRASAFDDNEPDTDGPRSTGQKAKEAGQVVLLLVLLALVGTCGYFVVAELFPGKLAPNAVFNRAFEAVQSDADVANHFGTPLNAYGRDAGGHREGRRNFVEHEEYEAPEDGSKRCRVRFNLQGPSGHAFVYAEVSNKLKSGEWVYLMVQDTQSGHVITLHDNRALIAGRAAASSPEEADALAVMLGRKK